MDDKQPILRGCQDTGNPVLDSLINLLSAWGRKSDEDVRAIHATLKELYEQEPRREVSRKRVSAEALQRRATR